ncbi:alpha/beta hydrolase [Natrinema sp. SYSU A 869]|uniref:alpha/beta fold hydrolase n=1 Tax=Natrinema sp. SYSU A 869 TaxID=2871694 RepID=UPI001CA3904B|nr:alpha/beta hydrolase [Natrinema sp. SYSU A 869]
MAEATPPDTGRDMETVTSADGTEIAFERTGSGLPLVLVHGGVCDHRFWELSDVRATFADHCTVYAMDCRGVGESGDVAERSSAGQPEAYASGDADEYNLEREFEDVAAVVETIDEPVTLLGHSSGALLSLEAALRTDNLHKLVLYEPPITFDDHKLYSDEVLAEMERLLKDGKNEQVLVLFLQEIAQSTPEEIDAQRSAPDWQDLVDAAHVWPRSLSAIGEYEFDAARFADMTTLTLLLSGSESPPLLKDATDPVHDALPNSRISTFDGHAHEAMLTAPDHFTEEVLGFIREEN